jgi:hypothetical protein
VKVSDFGLSSLKEKMYKSKPKGKGDDELKDDDKPGERPREELGTISWSAPEVGVSIHPLM